MSTYIVAILFGLVQGITELLPISSSGHLLILHAFLDIPVKNELVFDVFLHLATLLAVLVYFYRDIIDLFKAIPRLMSRQAGADVWLLRYLLVGTIPAAALGYFLDDLVENTLRSVWVVVVMLVVVGILLVVAEKKANQSKAIGDIGYKGALTIGLAQAVALIPGTSRSGATMLAGLYHGLHRTEAARFSFLLSAPIIAGAVLVKLPDMAAEFSDAEAGIWLAASLAAFLSALLSIRFLLAFVRSHKFTGFGIYRIILAVGIAVGLLMK